MTKIKLLLVGLLLVALSSNSFAQFSHSKELLLALNPAPIGMNLLIGNDAGMFETTGQAFGSGMMDFSGVIPLLPFWIKAPEETFGYGVPVGIRISKYRFAQDLVFTKNEDLKQIDVMVDNDPEHSFNHNFFSYEGSKLVTGYIHVPLAFNLNITDEFRILGSVFYDRYLFGYHKLKYTEAGETVKKVIKNKDFKNYYLNKNKFGVSCGIMYGSFGIGGTYVPSTFFEAGRGPELQELRVGLIYQKLK